MTSGKRICRLSLDDLDPVDKDTCLSTYKLASQSKISTIFPKDKAPKPIVLRFESSDKQDKNKYISTKLTLHDRTPSLEEVDNRLESKPSSIFSSAKTQDLDADVDPNEFFENFDHLVQVKYEQSKQNVKRFTPDSTSKDFSQDLKESGLPLIADQAKNSNRKSSEDTLNLSQNLLWYLKQQTNNKLHSLEDIEPAFSFSEDRQNKRFENREIGTIPRWFSKQRTSARFSSKEKTEKRQWTQKELKLDDKLDYSFKDVYHLNETKQKPKRASINLNTQFSVQRNTRGETSSIEKIICSRDNSRRQPNMQILRDITGQSYKEKINSTKSYGSYLFGEKAQEPKIADMLKNLQKKTDKISENMLMKLQGTGLENVKSVQEREKDEENACKKLNFALENCFAGYKKGRVQDSGSRSRVKTVNQTMVDSNCDRSFDGYLESIGRRSASSQNK